VEEVLVQQIGRHRKYGEVNSFSSGARYGYRFCSLELSRLSQDEFLVKSSAAHSRELDSIYIHD
jgi:hypothetical protein